MADARTLHEIAIALRALQIRALEADSAVAQAFLAMTESVIHDMAIQAEKEDRQEATVGRLITLPDRKPRIEPPARRFPRSRG